VGGTPPAQIHIYRDGVGIAFFASTVERSTSFRGKLMEARTAVVAPRYIGGAWTVAVGTTFSSTRSPACSTLVTLSYMLTWQKTSNLDSTISYILMYQ
jgi:hypothetical protein